MFTVEDIDDTLARLCKRGAQLIGEVVQFEDANRLCYIRGPKGFSSGLPKNSGEKLQCRWRRNGVTVGGAEMAWVRERPGSCPWWRADATLA